MRARRSMVLVAGLVLAISSIGGPAVGQGPRADDADASEEGRHILLLRDDAGALGSAIDTVLADVALDLAPSSLHRLATAWLTQRVVAVHDTGLRSVVVEELPDRVLEALATHPDVRAVEADRAMAVASVPTGVDRVEADRLPAAGLGSGRDVDVDVAIIDTGVDRGLADLGVVASWDCTNRTCVAGGGTDGDGHGTHVAGIVAARDDGHGPVGMAPGARVWSLKVLDGLGQSGSVSDVLAALDVVAGRADTIDVANISLAGMGRSAALDDAIARVTARGVTVVVAAGNHGGDASRVTPANAPDAVTVSGIVDSDGRPGARGDDGCGADDRLARWSNTGGVVDVAAPGGCITSLAPGGGTQSRSGTSMAAPHVTGAVAQFIAIHELDGSARADTVRRRMLVDWTTPQRGPCGFTGGRSSEPLLLLVPCRSGTEAEAPQPAPSPAPAPSPEPAPAPAPSAAIHQVDLEERTQLVLFRAVLASVDVSVTGAAVGDAVLEVAMERDGEVVDRRTSRVGSDGTAHIRYGDIESGCHTLVVTAVRVDGRRLHPDTPANELCVD